MGGRLFQLVDHLDTGEGVSNVVRAFVPMLAAAGGEWPVVVRHATDAVRAETRPLESVRWRRDDAVIVHVYGWTRLQRFLEGFPGRKLLYFHNVTPPAHFSRGSVLRRMTAAGWTQVPRLTELADVWAAPSAFNLRALAALAPAARPAYVLPPPIDAEVERARPADARRLAALRARDEVNVLFVGRLAPHKRQELVMAAFDRYHRALEPRSRLHLVGTADSDPAYARGLEALRARFPSRDAIELPGKVSEAEHTAYLQAADLFLSFSAHEGLCLPPLLAATHGVPVLARALAAVPETVGPAALLLHADDPARTAELMHLVREQPSLRRRLQDAGARHLQRFAPAAVERAWEAALAALRQ